MKPPAESTTEVFAGLVEQVTFHNEENGFCVLRVKARGKRDLITVVGMLPQFRPGSSSRPAANGTMTAPMVCSSAPAS